MTPSPIIVVLATRNQGKVRELTALLGDRVAEVRGLDLYPELGEIAETGTTFAENALIKARAVAAHTGHFALADDSGLAVDALGGAPGVYSARYSGELATDASNNRKLLQALKGVPDDKRGCRFVSVVALCAPPAADDDPEGASCVCELSEGVWEGRVLTMPKGKNGFGYDPLFLDPELGRTAAEMAPDVKNGRSHRGKALAGLLEKWPEIMARLNPPR